MTMKFNTALVLVLALAGVFLPLWFSLHADHHGATTAAGGIYTTALVAHQQRHHHGATTTSSTSYHPQRRRHHHHFYTNPPSTIPRLEAPVAPTFAEPRPIGGGSMERAGMSAFNSAGRW